MVIYLDDFTSSVGTYIALCLNLARYADLVLGADSRDVERVEDLYVDWQS